MNKILLTILFVMISCTSVNAYSCAGARVVVDHPKYKFHMQMSGALYDPDSKIIALSTAFMNSKSHNVRQFIFAHECGHHNVGKSEMGSDNYAFNLLKRKGIKLTENDLNSICKDVGSVRCLNLLNK